MSGWSSRETGKNDSGRDIDSLRKAIPAIEQFDEDLFDLDLELDKETLSEIVKRLQEENEGDSKPTAAGCFGIVYEVLQNFMEKSLLDLENKAKAEHENAFRTPVTSKKRKHAV